MRAYIRRNPAKLAFPNGVFSFKSKFVGSSLKEVTVPPIDGGEITNPSCTICQDFACGTEATSREANYLCHSTRTIRFLLFL